MCWCFSCVAINKRNNGSVEEEMESKSVPPSNPSFLAQFQTHLNIAPSNSRQTIETAQSTTGSSDDSTSPSDMAPPSTMSMEDKKRLTACLVCRKRKLKCDSARPKCASCSRLGHAWYATPQIQGADRLVDMKKLGKSPGRNKAMSRN